MNINNYLSELKNIQNDIIEFIETGEDLYSIVELFNNTNIGENRREFKLILRLLVKISKNYHHGINFYPRIEQIILLLQNQIKQTFSNLEIFDIIKSNKRIILFFVKKNIITIDQPIINIISGDKYKKANYIEYLLDLNIQDIDSYDKKRMIGENDDYICELIRNDLAPEFISFSTQANLNLESSIKPSIFETNSFLIKRNKTSLIEYAVFFGAIQIFHFLRLSDVEMTSSLWLYAIHSNNASMIHLLEEYNPIDSTVSYFEIFKEAIKCHHNSIASYIKDNFLLDDKLCFDIENKFNDNAFNTAFANYNFEFFPEDFENKFTIFYLVKYDYFEFVEFLLNTKTEKNSYEVIQLLLEQTENGIKEEYFKECKKLIQITIPSTVTNIETSSFEQCSSLSEVSILSPINEIPEYIFNECTSLFKVTFPSSVQKIAKCAFCQCISLVEIDLSSVIEIDNSSFEECSSLYKVTFSSSLKSLGPYSFNLCKSLKEVTIPSSLTKIEKGTFKDCSSLEYISIPSSITAIGEFSFNGCNSLKEISIPPSINIIAMHLFQDCNSLKEVKIPPSVTIIDSYAFYKCFSLEQIEIPSSIKKINKFAFFGCIKLKEIQIPPITIIDESCFGNCETLKNVIIPSTVTEIKVKAFYGCNSLEEITIPSSVKKIHIDAFNKCPSLKQVNCSSANILDDNLRSKKINII